MTFIVNTGEGLHYLPTEEAYIGETEFTERARHTQEMLSCVGNEQRALILATSLPYADWPNGDIDNLWPEQDKEVFGTKDIRRNLEKLINGLGIETPRSTIISSTIKDYLEPMGVLEFVEKTAKERLYVRGVNFELAAAASGQLLASGLEHNIALSKVFGYGRRLSQDANHESSPAFTRASIIAYAHAASLSGRPISLKEISSMMPNGLLSRSYKRHVKALIDAGIITDKSGPQAAYIEHPEYRFSEDDLPTTEEIEGSLNSRIVLAMQLLKDSGAQTFSPKEIAIIIFPDADEANIRRHACRIAERLDQMVDSRLAVRATNPKKAIERIGLNAEQMGFAKDILRIIDGIANPTEDFVEEGLAELGDILRDPMAVGHLLQRTRANVPAYHRKSRGLRRLELVRYLEVAGSPLTLEEIASAMGLNTNYLHSLMQDLRRDGRAIDTPSDTGRSARWQLSK